MDYVTWLSDETSAADWAEPQADGEQQQHLEAASSGDTFADALDTPSVEVPSASGASSPEHSEKAPAAKRDRLDPLPETAEEFAEEEATALPEEPEASAQPAEPEEPEAEASTQPEEPVEPEASTQPDEPEEPDALTQPEESEEPEASAQPEEPEEQLEEFEETEASAQPEEQLEELEETEASPQPEEAEEPEAEDPTEQEADTQGEELLPAEAGLPELDSSEASADEMVAEWSDALREPVVDLSAVDVLDPESRADASASASKPDFEPACDYSPSSFTGDSELPEVNGH